MKSRQAKRIHRQLTPSEEDRLTHYRQQIAEELPDLQARDQMRNEARNETTLSGELRRAIHASDLSLAEIAGRVGTTPLVLDEFLTGERTLRSDVIDRLAGVLGYELNRVQ
jgi:hypothetical protein